MKRKLLLMAVFLLVLGTSGSVFALTIDFTDKIWAGAEGETEYTVEDYDGWLDVTLNGSTLYGYLPAKISYQTDGLGIDGWSWFDEEDEVDSWQVLQVSFEPDVIVNSITLYDVESNETAKYMLDSESLEWVLAFGSEGVETPFTIITGSTEAVSWIKISAGCGSNVALAALDVSAASVPEPATMLLLGIGLVGIAGIPRKKISRKK